jgi:hypothetical protein
MEHFANPIPVLAYVFSGRHTGLARMEPLGLSGLKIFSCNRPFPLARPLTDPISAWPPRYSGKAKNRPRTKELE